MIRFLNLLILSLTTWHDVRSKISLSITAMSLTGLGTLIVVTTVAADTFSRPVLTYHRRSVLAAQSNGEESSVSSRERSLSTLVARPTSTSPITTHDSTTDEHSKVSAPQPSTQPTSQNVVPQASSTVPPASDQGSTSVQKNSLQLAQPQLFCDQGKSAWRIVSAQLLLQTPLPNASTVMWNWEARVDSASSDQTPANLVPTDQFSQPTTANVSSITLAATDSTRPLLIALVSADYAYSVRLHVTAPVDLTSDWVSIPQLANTSCQSGPS